MEHVLKSVCKLGGGGGKDSSSRFVKVEKHCLPLCMKQSYVHIQQGNVSKCSSLQVYIRLQQVPVTVLIIPRKKNNLYKGNLSNIFPSQN